MSEGDWKAEAENYRALYNLERKRVAAIKKYLPLMLVPRGGGEVGVRRVAECHLCGGPTGEGHEGGHIEQCPLHDNWTPEEATHEPT